MAEKFDYQLNYAKLDLRKKPRLYRVGRGEQGVLLVQPYKGEILPHWKFKTPKDAKKSANEILKIFRAYLKQDDFVGADLARKFLQMGYTRSRRYANHKSGKKYEGPVPRALRGVSGAHGRPLLPRVMDQVKAESAVIFYVAWQKAEAVKKYARLKAEWKSLYG